MLFNLLTEPDLGALADRPTHDKPLEPSRNRTALITVADTIATNVWCYAIEMTSPYGSISARLYRLGNGAMKALPSMR